MKRRLPKAGPVEAPEKQLAGFIDKFDPAIAKLARSCPLAYAAD